MTTEPIFDLTLDDIEAARGIVAEATIRTPLVRAPKFSAMTGADVYVKYETKQVTSSFKDRGASVKLTDLAADPSCTGVIAMSAGNHAQAVAYHAKRVGLPATIIMPEATPFVKVAATEAHGARILLEGETLAECRPRVDKEIAENPGLTLVHPYDDPRVMAGQGTIGLEMLEDQPDLDTIVVPIGGGGLISGVSVAVKALKPGIDIYGVETEFYPSMTAALAGETPTFGGDTLAEGIAVKVASPSAVEIVRKHVRDIILVNEDAIEQAIYAYLVHEKATAEGAGASPLAAMLRRPDLFHGRKVGLILCGGNIDPRMISAVTVRALGREHRIISLRILIRDRPGVLAQVANRIGKMGGNILEVSHHRLFLNVPATGATLDVTIEARDGPHGETIIQAIREDGFEVQRLPSLMNE